MQLYRSDFLYVSCNACILQYNRAHKHEHIFHVGNTLCCFILDALCILLATSEDFILDLDLSRTNKICIQIFKIYPVLLVKMFSGVLQMTVL